jgi:hypothetical protein
MSDEPDEISELVDWQLSRKQPDIINVFAGDYTGTWAVHLCVNDGSGLTWLPLTPLEARGLAKWLIEEASEAEAGALEENSDGDLVT